MDITAVGPSNQEALFAEMMNSSSSPQHQQLPVSGNGCQVKVEKRRNKRRGDLAKKQRPVSMTTYPSGSAYSIPGLQTSGHGPLMEQSSSLRGSASALGRGFPFAKPKAFFSSEQHLPARVENYNKNREGLFQLRAASASQDDIYSGLLKFHYSDGLGNFTENLQVQTSSTVSDLLPELITLFLPHEYQLDAVDGTQPTSIVLVQGQMERELETDEKPLEIALDCTARGVASPKFHFKCTLPPSAGPPLTPRRSSTGLRGVMAGGEELGHQDLSQPDHYNSLSSLGSGFSLASSKSAKSKSSSSLTGGKHSKKKSGPSPTTSPSHVKNHTTTATLAAPQAEVQTSTPVSGKKMSLSKQAVSNFISRSLRGRRKAKNSASASNVVSSSNESTLRVLAHPQETSTDFIEVEDDDDDDLDTQLTSSLISPVERKFTLSTVMHIYFTEGKQAQVYKSVLVSEKATTQEVIAQALERYNIKLKRPEDYTLFDVIGKWEAVTSTFQSQLTGVMGGGGSAPLKPVSTLPNNLNILNASPLIKRRTAVEEFVVCYCRELAPHESPYNAQFYLTTQEGFTRRFELKSKGDPSPLMTTRGSIHHEKSHSVDIMERPDDQATPTPAELDKNVEEEDMGILFGITSHNRKRSKRNRIVNQSIDSADPDSMEITILKDSTLKSSNTRGQGRVGTVRESKNGKNDELDSEIPITMMSRSGAPDFSALRKSMNSPPDNFHRNHHHSNHTQRRSSPGSAHTPSSPSHYATTTTTTVSPTSSFSERSDQSSTALCPTSNLECAFLLNLRICSPSKEHLVHRLLSDDVKLGSWSSPNGTGPSTEKIHLHSPEFSQTDGPICCICRQPISDATPPLTDLENSMKFSFIIKRAVSSKIPVLVNGEEVSSSVSLRHGDIVSIGETGLFMFNDVTSFSTGSIPLYRWKPHSLAPPPSSSTIRPTMSMSTSIETITEFSTSSKAAEKSNSPRKGDISNHSKLTESPISSSSLTSPPSSHSPMSTRKVKGHFKDMQEAKKPQHINNGGGGGGGKVKDRTTSDPDATPTTPNGFVAARDRSLSQNKRTTNQVRTHQVVTKTRSLPLPKERKLVFSFKASEEDHLLNHIISDQSYRECSPCKLAPVYVLAMCTEYCLMSSGPDAVARFVQKATDRIQGTVWDFTKKLESWQPEESDIPRSPGAVLKKLFPLLEPVFFWLANTLEFYNFLTTNSEELHLPAATPSQKAPHHQRNEGAEEGEEDALGTLYSVLVYTYQKAFYPVSKVLYQSLPQMLESCVEESLIESKEKRPIVIGEAVGFLQALLELINEQNLHLEVVSQFYANIFFFVNTAMFNALVEQGGELGLYQYHSGTALRKNLSLLEGWACQVGFKDSVLHYLAKFSGAIDLLATPTEKLLKMNWSDLRCEFPVLQPVQLHFLLSQYLLPPSITEVPRHWTPSKQDALHALTGSSLQESFDSHPGLELPTSGYALDLNQPPAEGEQFQGILEKLRSHLHQVSAETDNSSSPEKVRNYSSTKAKTAKNLRNDFERGGGGGKEKEFEIMDIRDVAPNGYNSSHAHTIVGSDTESREDLHVVTASLLSSAVSKQRNIRNLEKNFRYHQQQQRHAHYPQQLSNNNNNNGSPQTTNIMESFQYRNGTTTTTNLPFHRQKVECVRSMLGPRSYSTPEKLVLNSDSTPATSSGDGCSWRDRFPRGSKAVTIPRGDKGFGFIMVEKRDPGSNESLIVVQQVLPGSTAAQCSQLKAGDHILAIDGQLLDGADYLIADKYVKEAEDDVTLTLAPRTLL